MLSSSSPRSSSSSSSSNEVNVFVFSIMNEGSSCVVYVVCCCSFANDAAGRSLAWRLVGRLLRACATIVLKGGLVRLHGVVSLYELNLENGLFAILHVSIN